VYDGVIVCVRCLVFVCFRVCVCSFVYSVYLLVCVWCVCVRVCVVKVYLCVLFMCVCCSTFVFVLCAGMFVIVALCVVLCC